MDGLNRINTNPLSKIIGLLVVLAVGFLLVVLAGVNGNWFPILDGIIFAIAYLPVAVTKSNTDFSFDTSNSNIGKEIGQFTTAFLLVSGVYLPIILKRSHYLTGVATTLTIIGGGLIYGTVYTFLTYFEEDQDDVI